MLTHTPSIFHSHTLSRPLILISFKMVLIFGATKNKSTRIKIKIQHANNNKPSCVCVYVLQQDVEHAIDYIFKSNRMKHMFHVVFAMPLFSFDKMNMIFPERASMCMYMIALMRTVVRDISTKGWEVCVCCDRRKNKC